MTMQRQLGWAVAAIAALAGLYILVFTLADGGLSVRSVWSAFANAVPAVLIGWLVANRIAPALWPVRSPGTIAGITATLIAYALVTYVLTIVLLALFWDNGAREGGLFIRYFTGPAFIWQSFQGLAYGGIALLSGWLLHIERLRREAEQNFGAPAPPAPLGRLLLRTEAGIVPVEADAIIRIAAADDYCEVILTNARHLARINMGECERLLANEPMIRAHRSHLINLRCLVSAEPTGDGRLQLTLSNGDQLTTSRAGARLIREQSG
jgi:two-component system, LytTR family, response regulator